MSFYIINIILGNGSTDIPCPTGMFRCPEGKCIPSLWVCNYQKDCEKGEDEFQSCRKYNNILYSMSFSMCRN